MTLPRASAARPHRLRGPVAAYFLARHALSAGDAIPYVPRTDEDRRWFERHRREGVVRQGAAGRFHYDLAAHYALEEARRRRMVPVAIVASLLVALLATLFYRG